MQIRILIAGKIRERYLREAMAVYLTRLAPYYKTTIDEFSVKHLSGKGSRITIGQRDNETRNVFLTELGSAGFVIALDAGGEAVTSEEFASRLQDLEIKGRGPLIFLIGGAFGLPMEIRDQAQHVLSLSPMTFPHQMVPLLLLEQIYRAACIKANVPYHK